MQNLSDKMISVIVPAFNEEACLATFCAALKSSLKTDGIRHEIIIVDDGSKDRTAEIIGQLAAADSAIRGVIFSRNFGKEAGIHAGLEIAGGDAVVVIDADGQHPIPVIAEMIKMWRQDGYLIISAIKRDRGDGWLSSLRARLFYSVFSRLAKIDLKNDTDFKLLDRKVVDLLNVMPERDRFFRGLSRWMGFHHGTVTFDVNERIAGESKWSTIGLTTYAVNALIAFSSTPLVLTIYLGILGIISSCIFAVVALILKYLGTALTGWTSLIIVVSMFGSLTLTSLGILGLYTMKIYDEVKRRHHYVVAKRFNLDHQKE